MITLLLLDAILRGMSFTTLPDASTIRSRNNFLPLHSVDDIAIDHATISPGDMWEDHYFSSQSIILNSEEEEQTYQRATQSYVSSVLRDMSEEDMNAFLTEISTKRSNETPQTSIQGKDTYVDEPYRKLRLLRRRMLDPLWAQIRLEAQHVLQTEPDAAPTIYERGLRQPSLVDALTSVISHEIATELMPATALHALILDQLQLSDDINLHLDVIASVNRDPSEESTALNALLFHQGLHALVCYRVAHRLWQAERTGLAYYIQSTVSSRYSADIHPAAEIDGGLYLNVGGGVVIGETARVGSDCTILQGVTLGGTGKEVGDRHPKIGDGVILHCGATVLGNINVGRGAIITAKSIVTKEVPELARVSGVPATVKSYRELPKDLFSRPSNDDDECDLDCQMKKLYESYLLSFQKLIEIESCMSGGENDCSEALDKMFTSHVY
jgi:serine O-acetyltransferase